ncbi:unnamed protein product [Phytophthora fragariaefolia]|uniref:Unnamed protein product n=1 Tax=Phytophthora fragariaefolia TaxID=1490495 RepID=A0A9W6XA75_9STRA|nr:unnamed protein product [Phytophthora fragariaefolia]
MPLDEILGGGECLPLITQHSHLRNADVVFSEAIGGGEGNIDIDVAVVWYNTPHYPPRRLDGQQSSDPRPAYCSSGTSFSIAYLATSTGMSCWIALAVSHEFSMS